MVQHPGPDGLLSTDSDRQVLERPAWTLRSGLFEVAAVCLVQRALELTGEKVALSELKYS